jgi:hypothetical protein
MRKAFVEQVALPEPRFRDGLGIRYVRTDGTDDPVEVLRPLWDVGMMQNALRQRVSRLASFRQARFVPVRAAEVPRDDASTIEIVSDYMSGYRLSQYLEASKAGVVSIETSTAIYILRELLGALALLHESRGVTHGAVAPERILITPKGRVVIADYVLGPAIERLEFTRPRLWREFHIPIPAGKGQPKLDDKADVLQVAVTALALLLGRPIDVAEYPERVESLVASLSQTQKAAGRAPLPAALVGWLKRALFKDANGKFAHVSDARLSLEGVLSKQDAATGGASALKALAEAFGRHAAALEAKAAAAAAEEARKAALAAQAAVQAALQEQAAAEAAAAPITELVPAFTIDPAAAPADSAAVPGPAPVASAEAEPPVGWRLPEALPDEETLPTSPLIPLVETVATPAAGAYVEEVLDLAGIAGPEEPAPAADAVLAAEDTPAHAVPVAAHALAPELQTAGAVVEVLVDLRDLAAGDQALESLEAMPAAVVPEAETVDFEAAPIGPTETQLFVAAVEPALEAVQPAPVETVAEPASVGDAQAPIEQVAMEARAEQEAAEPTRPAEVAEVMAEVLEALEAEQGPPPVPSGDVLPEWRLLADPVGATAPTIDVEVPTESLDELVAAFAATLPETAPEVQPADAAVELPALDQAAPAFSRDMHAVSAEPPGIEVESLPLEPPVEAPGPEPHVLAVPAPDANAVVPASAPDASEAAPQVVIFASEAQPVDLGVPAIDAETALVAAEPPVVEVDTPVDELESPSFLPEESAAAWDVSAPAAEAPALEAGAATLEPQVAATEPEAPIFAVDAPGPAPAPEAPVVEDATAASGMHAGGPESLSAVMEPPSIMLKAAVPFLDAPAPLSPPPAAAVPTEDVPAAAAASVLDEILDLQHAQAAAQAVVDVGHAAPPAMPDVSEWSFVEELLHHDARFEQREAVEDVSLQTAASAERTDREQPAPPAGLAVPAAEHAAPDYGEPAPALEETVPFLRKVTPASVPRVPVAKEAPAAADDTPSSVEETAPPLPPDWYIEVGPAAIAKAPAVADRQAAVPVPEAAPALEPASAVFSEASRQERESPGPDPGGPALQEPDEDLSGPVFPRVAPSVRRVRAEARRRRMARLRHGAVHALEATATSLTSAAGAVVHGVAAAFAGAARGSAAAVGAVAAGVMALVAATARALGGLARAAGAGMAAVARGLAKAGAASLRSLAAVVRAGGAGLTWIARAAAKVTATVLGGIARGIARGLRALAAGAVSSVRMVGKAAAASLRSLGSAARFGVRGLGAGATAIGRAGSAAASGAARLARTSAAGAGRAAGPTAGGTASAASAARGAAGRSAAAGRGFGRSIIAFPRQLYFVLSDAADRVPKPVVRPWHFAAALLVMAAVAGVPYAKALLDTPKVEVGTIRVESARPDELVTIDGVPQGRAPVTVSLPVGRHRIEVGSAGRMRPHEVEVTAGRQTLLQAAGPELKATGSLRVSTDPAGAEVLVDGMLQGTAPLTVENLAEGEHALLVRDKSGSVRQTVQVKAEGVADASVQIRPGWLAVFAPVKLTVLENGKPIGSTEAGRMLLSPGPHTVEIVSQAIGYRETRSFDIKPGQVSAVTIQMPPATIEVVAPPGAEVFVDGQSVGQAPLGPLQVAVGTREITMRHPALGDRRQVVSVTFNAPVKVVFE